ncbi:MAG TPA: DUF2092 domain-containing protein [Polyangiaceae bacterium]|jgi:hypothetical protein|nr:DUF2092 domain-containing protein [Polyangiaceae bacterium]
MISVRPLLGALLGLVFVADTHAKPAAAKEDEGVIEPQADAVLHRMSDYLAGLQAFRMETTSVDEKVTTEHQKIQELKESKVSVKRPGRLRVDRAGPKGHAVFRDDGQRFTLFHVEKNVFTDAPAPPTIDAAVDNVRQRLGVDAPAGDLIVSDAYNALTDGVKVARYVGLEPIGNVQAHHLAMRKKDVDYQLWIQDGPQAVPLRYVIVSKDMPSQPEYTLEMRAWDVNPSIADDEFKLEVPPNAKRVDLTMKQQEKKP